MSSCEVESVFIGAGCNRIVNNVSWGASNLVSFGAHNAVAIFCPKVPTTHYPLPYQSIILCVCICVCMRVCYSVCNYVCVLIYYVCVFLICRLHRY